jgi:hypothetical protein
MTCCRGPRQDREHAPCLPLAHRVTSLRCNDSSSIGDELDSGNQSDRRIHEFAAQSRFRFDRTETGLWIPDLTRFPDANRYSPRIKSGAGFRWKTLWAGFYCGSLGILSAKPLKQVSRSSSSFIKRQSITAFAAGALGFGLGAKMAS